jgi:hypothetical protein
MNLIYEYMCSVYVMDHGWLIINMIKYMNT